MHTLKRRLPFSGHEEEEEEEELKKIAVRFEDKIYTAATSRNDYLRKISLKMLKMGAAANSVNPSAPLDLMAQSHMKYLQQAQQTHFQWTQVQSHENKMNLQTQIQQSNKKPIQQQNLLPTQVQSFPQLKQEVGDPTMESGDWRAQLQRQRIVNKIMDTLKTRLPFSGYERQQELKKIAERVEDEIYTAATSQSEYSRKICLNMLTMETRLQNLMSDPLQSNSAAIRVNASAPFDSTAQTDNPNGGDWQEKVYQKIKAMKEWYLLDLKPTHGASGDWKAQFQAELRQRIVNKIMETLKRHSPFSGHEGLQELTKIAERFEEKIYIAATSQNDYLLKISLKMLTMYNTRPQDPILDFMQSYSADNSDNPSDLGSQVMLQVNNQGQQLPNPGLPNNFQQRMSPIMRSNIGSVGMQGYSGLSSALPPGSGFQQPTMASVAGQNSSLQNIQNMSSVQENQLIGQQYNYSHMQQQRLRPTEGASGAVDDPTMESVDWRAQLQANSRERITNKIMETLKRHSPFSGHEGLQELEKIAKWFEEKIYITATSQSDYLRKISLKMLTMENTRSQDPMSDLMHSYSAVNPSDPGYEVVQQVNNQGQQFPIPVTPNDIQKMMSQSMHSNIGSTGMQGSSSLSSALPPGSGLQQPTMASVAGQNSSLQNIQKLSSVQQYNYSHMHQQQLLQQLLQQRLRPTEGASGAVGDPTMESGDWRAQLQADSRERITNKIIDTLKWHLPFSEHEGQQDHKKIAETLEEEIYAVAISLPDYLRKISLKMLTMESRSQNPISDPM